MKNEIGARVCAFESEANEHITDRSRSVLDRSEQISGGKHKHSRRDRIGAAIVLVGTFLVFWLCPVHTISDSRYEMFFSQQLLWHQSFSVSASAIPELQSDQPGHELPWQLSQVGERFYHYYPVGNIIFPMPYVALANAMGISAIDQDGKYNPTGDAWMQKVLAALLMAALAIIIFFIARLFLSFEWSILITAATAFGTQMWSTASRAMWSHTPGIFILGVVLFLIVRTETRKARLPPVLLGTCLSWLYLIRPNFTFSIIAIAVYVLIYHRPILFPFIFTGCVWLAALIIYSEHHFGQLLPPYYHIYRLGTFAGFGERLAGVLISPSRGLLVYVPALMIVGYLLVRYYSTSMRGLVNLAVAVVGSHLLFIGTFANWHGGGSYGPRLLTDLVPWFGLLGMLAVKARCRWHDVNPARDPLFRRRVETAAAAVLLACSVMVNGLGAISIRTEMWGYVEATNYNQWLRNLWDWRHPQFMGMPDSWLAEWQKSLKQTGNTNAADVSRTHH